jgi:ribonuclease I
MLKYLLFFCLVIQINSLCDFGYYELALNKEVVNSTFTIHGLWPDYNNTSYPQFCTNTPFNITRLEPIITNMTQYWYSYMTSNLIFWTHEWDKHGTCSCLCNKIICQPYDELTYFTTVLDLYYKFNKNCNETELTCMIKLSKDLEPFSQ